MRPAGDGAAAVRRAQASRCAGTAAHRAQPGREPTRSCPPRRSGRRSVGVELRATSTPPSGSPITRHRAPSDSTAPIRRPCRCSAGEPLHDAEQRWQLDAVADAADQRGHACQAQVGCEANPEVGDPDSERAGAEQVAERPLREIARRRCCRARRRRPTSSAAVRSPGRPPSGWSSRRPPRSGPPSRRRPSRSSPASSNRSRAVSLMWFHARRRRARTVTGLRLLDVGVES